MSEYRIKTDTWNIGNREPDGSVWIRLYAADDMYWIATKTNVALCIANEQLLYLIEKGIEAILLEDEQITEATVL